MDVVSHYAHRPAQVDLDPLMPIRAPVWPLAPFFLASWRRPKQQMETFRLTIIKPSKAALTDPQDFG